MGLGVERRRCRQDVRGHRPLGTPRENRAREVDRIDPIDRVDGVDEAGGRVPPLGSSVVSPTLALDSRAASGGAATPGARDRSGTLLFAKVCAIRGNPVEK